MQRFCYMENQKFYSALFVWNEQLSNGMVSLWITATRLDKRFTWRDDTSFILGYILSKLYQDFYILNSWIYEFMLNDVEFSWKSICLIKIEILLSRYSRSSGWYFRGEILLSFPFIPHFHAILHDLESNAEVMKAKCVWFLSVLQWNTKYCNIQQFWYLIRHSLHST